MKCKNCKWEWELESDDKNPYLCHKCGYDSILKDFDMKSLKKWEKENKPYSEKIKEGYYYRSFKSDLNSDELVWHRDREDRIVESVGDTDWLIQIDNELPKKLEKILIPKGVYHRVIKGSGDLVIKMRKLLL
jgi:hypothetical protein